MNKALVKNILVVTAGFLLGAAILSYGQSIPQIDKLREAFDR